VCRCRRRAANLFERRLRSRPARGLHLQRAPLHEGGGWPLVRLGDESRPKEGLSFRSHAGVLSGSSAVGDSSIRPANSPRRQRTATRKSWLRTAPVGLEVRHRCSACSARSDSGAGIGRTDVATHPRRRQDDACLSSRSGVEFEHVEIEEGGRRGRDENGHRSPHRPAPPSTRPGVRSRQTNDPRCPRGSPRSTRRWHARASATARSSWREES
jgi:hypothetical protein